MREEVKEVGVLDDWEREVEARGKSMQSESIAQNLIRLGTMALDEIAKACGLTLQHVQELAEGK